MELAYGIEKVLKGDLPRLTHGSDGLIFTSAEAQYCFGTDDNMCASDVRAQRRADPSLQYEMEAAIREFNRLSTRPPLPRDQSDAAPRRRLHGQADIRLDDERRARPGRVFRHARDVRRRVGPVRFPSCIGDES